MYPTEVVPLLTLAAPAAADSALRVEDRRRPGGEECPERRRIEKRTLCCLDGHGHAMANDNWPYRTNTDAVGYHEDKSTLLPP